jgi:hypothetical protein
VWTIGGVPAGVVAAFLVALCSLAGCDSDHAPVEAFDDRPAANALASCEKRTTTLTFEDDIKRITDQACATCHPGVRPSDLTGVAGFRAQRLAAYEYLVGRRSQPMPPYAPGFASTANGRKLVEWLCGAKELQ